MLVFVLALVGGVVGFASLGWSPGGFAAGAAIGALAGSIAELRDRVFKLEQRLGRAERVENAAARAQKSAHAAAAATAPDAAHEPVPRAVRDPASDEGVRPAPAAAPPESPAP